MSCGAARDTITTEDGVELAVGSVADGDLLGRSGTSIVGVDPASLGGGALVWLGAWSGATAYVIGDAVESGGSSYVCILGHTNFVPPNATYWDVLAAKGSTGATGAAGAAGATGATGATGAAGAAGAAGADGTTLYDYVDTQTDVTGTAAETTLYSRSIGANDLGTSRMLRLVIGGEYLNNSGVGVTNLFRVKFGATTMWDGGASSSLASNANRRAFRLELHLVAYGATNAQRVDGMLIIGPAGAATAGTGIGSGAPTVMTPFFGSAAEDSTAAKTLEITVRHSSGSGSVSTRLEFARIEQLIP